MSLAIEAPQILIRSTPTRPFHLELGSIYNVTGDGEGVEQIVPQVFRLERFSRVDKSGTMLLVGTLWWRVWTAGKWFGGSNDNHHMAVHHVNVGVGSGLSSRHNFHLEKIDPNEVSKVLGRGKIYAEYLRSVDGRGILRA